MNELLDDDLLALLLADAEATDADQPTALRSRLDQAPLSYAQQRLWLVQQQAPANAAYNLPRALRLDGDLDPQALENALNAVIDRHDILRSAFREIDGVPVQVVERSTRLNLKRQDLVSLDAETREMHLQQRVQTQALQPFDLSRAPLIRTTLIKTGERTHVLLLNMHHIVSDAWSNAILMQDLARAYAQASAGISPTLSELPIQYSDYAQWQRGEYLDSVACKRADHYWRQYLGRDLPVLELPTDHARSEGQQHLAGRHSFSLASRDVQALNSFCQREGLTPFVVVMGAWQILLSRYSQQREFTVGVPNASRNRSDSQELVGFFVSSQVYKANLDGQQPVRDFLQSLRAHSLATLEHADYPLELLFDQLQRGSAASLNPLFQVLLNWRTGGAEPAAVEWGGLHLQFLDAGESQAKFDLSLDVDFSPQSLVATFEYSRDLYTPATVERMGRHWQNLLQQLLQAPGLQLNELQLLDAQEQQQTLAEWNPQQTRINPSLCLHQLIEAQVARAGDAIALTFGEQQVSYAELNRQANRLAHQLIAHGVGADVLVGIAAERSPQMLIGLLAILKAGGAYVPLDPAYPADRLGYMIEDSRIDWVLTQAHLREQLPLPPHVRCVLLDDEAAQADHPEHNPNVAMQPDNLAYVIYTSGSTGKPKGALLPHHNVVRLFKATEGWFGFDQHDVWSLFHSYAFDFSVWEIFGALLYGGRLVIVPHAVSRSPQDVYTLLCEEKVSVLNQTPSAFKQLMKVACAADQTLTQQLRYVIFGGEAIEVKSLRPWFERFGDHAPQLINMYGITETTVHVTYRPLSMADLNTESASPIGVPITDLSWYLLDEALDPVAKGCTGELYIGRAGLARGYLNRTDLTSTRFIPDPFDSVPGGRLYRTGDLAKYCNDGSIEYVGRIDHQVKIRGFRIELGEIEARLLDQPEVQDCAVLTHEGPGGLQLVAYVIADDSADLRDRLISALRAQLPDYMVPSHLLFLERFPLNANGKLDRKALPEPDASLWQRTYVAAANPLEQALVALWQQSLNIERVGVTDNFFELGGHSILAIQLIGQLKAQLDIEVRLQALLANPTIAELSAFIARQHFESAQCVVELNSAPADAPALFCLHPSGGFVFCYQPLAKRLNAGNKVYGVMHRGFSEQHNDEQTWAQMIAAYSREIVSTQPQGPYHLMGWSLGGALAMDIAATLESQGHEVAFLGLVDGTIPAAAFPADMLRFQRVDEEALSGTTEEVLDAVHYFNLLFPTLALRTAAYLQASPQGTVKDFYDWAAGQIEPGQGDVLAIVQSIKSEVMNAQAFSVHDRLVEAFEAFTYKPLRVKPSCWWAVPEKTAEELAFSQALIQRYSQSGELNCSHLVPLEHRSMIFQDELLDTLIETFQASTAPR
ncbi:non-ribosomal peptide synthetase [Pseudomonas sp. PB106]|uniref:non-ribosomal peptide synthetase n=1 Tax=Pseudomonas sp. PB106 TaxID=2494699 RepID=UPI00131DAB0F|nr:non-ribosomal peptide synthetase [Pseudomonas sp. PB106]KAE9648633.1 amino acid adenylation domain-containing protein [Pseudomonas sp. PB106]